MALFFQKHKLEKYLLRVSILFILLLSLPLQPEFYKTLFTISWQYFIAGRIQVGDIFAALFRRTE